MFGGVAGLLLLLASLPAPPNFPARSSGISTSRHAVEAHLQPGQLQLTPADTALSQRLQSVSQVPGALPELVCGEQVCRVTRDQLYNPLARAKDVPQLFPVRFGLRPEDSATSSSSHDPDEDQGSAFSIPRNSFVAIEAIPLSLDQLKPPKVQWVQVTGASLRYLTVMHTFRLATEAGTRYGLQHNAFWGGYLAALGAMHGWSDGDGYYENYLGHPVQGSVSAYIWIHNDVGYRNVEFGKNPLYWKSRLRAYAYAWAFSEQFEVGLLSEASIGQIQRYCCQYGFVDHVITPNLGIAWVVGEDALDKYVVRKIEDRHHNLGVRIAARIILNPVQSFANFMNFEYPWHRENREAPTDYESSGYYASYVQSQTRENQTYPLVPKFEITATLPSVMNVGDLSCLGGGGVAGFKVSDNWQWTAEVSGCTLGNSLPQNWSGDSLTFTTGPQWIRHTESRWSPHAHMRLGGQKITLQHTDPEKRQLIENMVPPGTKLNPYYNLFNTNYESTGLSLSMGGGVDYRLYSGLALRVANLDYVRSWLAPVNGIDFNRGVRFTTGVVLRVGTW